MKTLKFIIHHQFNKTSQSWNRNTENTMFQGSEHGPEQEENCASFVPGTNINQSFALGVSETSIASTDSSPTSEQIPVNCWTR